MPFRLNDRGFVFLPFGLVATVFVYFCLWEVSRIRFDLQYKESAACLKRVKMTEHKGNLGGIY